MIPKADPQIAAEAAKALGLTKLVPVVYEDLLQPAAQQVGRQLVIVAKAISVALAPLEGVVWGYEQIKEFLAVKVAARLANKPTCEIKTADRVIAGPILLNMVFAVEAPHLREMYANLLATAMHTPSASKVHPSFVHVIQRLTPLEAQILKELGKKYHKGDAMFREHMTVWETSFIMAPGSAPFVGASISSEWQAVCASFGVTENLADAFYQNLLTLGILSMQIEDDGVEPFPGDTEERNLLRCVYLTTYGDMFLDACVRDV